MHKLINWIFTPDKNMKTTTGASINMLLKFLLAFFVIGDLVLLFGVMVFLLTHNN